MTNISIAAYYDSLCTYIHLQIVVFQHLVYRLAMTVLSLSVDSSVVCSNVCYTSREIGSQVAQQIQCYCCIVFTIHPHKQYHPVSPVSYYLWPFFIPDGIAKVNVHKGHM